MTWKKQTQFIENKARVLWKLAMNPIFGTEQRIGPVTANCENGVAYVKSLDSIISSLFLTNV